MSRKGSTNNQELCGDCEKGVGSKNGIRCKMCETMYHIKCQGLPDGISEILGIEAVHWYCKCCNKKAVPILQSIIKLEKKHEQFQEDIKEVNNNLTNINAEMGKMFASFANMDARIKELEMLLKENSDKNLNHSNFEFLRTDAPLCNREDIVEEIEINKRKMNLVVMGISEDSNMGGKVAEIFASLVENTKELIVKCERIGIQKGEKPRPTRVVLNDINVRNKILKCASTLAKTETYKQIFIVPDLTLKQQAKDKELRDKVKELRNSGHQEVRIKRGEVISRIEGRDVVLYPPSQSSH